MNVSSSRLAFPQYVPDLTSAQRRVIEDYIGRIRAQLIRVLDGQNVERPPADIPVARSLHSTLTFVDIAVEELKPEYMRGYGEVPPASRGRIERHCRRTPRPGETIGSLSNARHGGEPAAAA